MHLIHMKGEYWPRMCCSLRWQCNEQGSRESSMTKGCSCIQGRVMGAKATLPPAIYLTPLLPDLAELATRLRQEMALHVF